jgi:hypothetical protein
MFIAFLQAWLAYETLYVVSHGAWAVQAPGGA